PAQIDQGDLQVGQHPAQGSQQGQQEGGGGEPAAGGFSGQDPPSNTDTQRQINQYFGHAGAVFVGNGIQEGMADDSRRQGQYGSRRCGGHLGRQGAQAGAHGGVGCKVHNGFPLNGTVFRPARAPGGGEGFTGTIPLVLNSRGSGMHLSREEEESWPTPEMCLEPGPPWTPPRGRSTSTGCAGWMKKAWPTSTSFLLPSAFCWKMSSATAAARPAPMM